MNMADYYWLFLLARFEIPEQSFATRDLFSLWRLLNTKVMWHSTFKDLLLGEFSNVPWKVKNNASAEA